MARPPAKLGATAQSRRHVMQPSTRTAPSPKMAARETKGGIEHATSGPWRKRSRPSIQAAPYPAARQAPPGFVAEGSALPASALMEHCDDDEALAAPAADAALGLSVSLPGMGGEDALEPLGGLGAVLFDPSDECFAGVCLLGGGEVVRLCGRVLQSFDCTADCCTRALIRVRTEVEAEGARMPAQTVLCKSELNLGDFWNWRSAVCSFSTEEVVTDRDARARIVAGHFGSLAEGDNMIGSAGVICVGPMQLRVALPPRSRGLSRAGGARAGGAWPPEGEQVVAALLARSTRCVWREDMQWLLQQKLSKRDAFAHGSAESWALGPLRARGAEAPAAERAG